MKKLTFFLIFISLFIFNSFSQKTNPVVFTINNDEVKLDEFLTVYRKNNAKETSIKIENLEEYLDLYINFKLKVKEALSLKMDTNSNFIKELEGYKKQLAKPFMIDKKMEEAIINEAYERMKQDIRVKHILIRLAPDASPEDSIKAYNKIVEARKRILNGEQFEKVAMEISEDPSAKQNGGDLGYFTSLEMVYPFETAAYNSKIGDLTMPVRTKFGYHLLYTIDKRDALIEMQVAHIMAKFPKDATVNDSLNAKKKIDDIYARLKAGEDFEKLAKELSDDNVYGPKGGVLPWFSNRGTLLEFEMEAVKLKNNGDYSAPIKTKLGWHIIKRIGKNNLASFEEKVPDIKQKITRDTRNLKASNSFINQLKKDYAFKKYDKNISSIYSTLDSSIYKKEWSLSKVKNLDKPVFELNGMVYTKRDLAKHIEDNQAAAKTLPINKLGETYYNNFEYTSIYNFELTKLDSKYPEFKMLMQEYKDGILLFELTNEKVWNKAVKDSLGLVNYYNVNSNKYLQKEKVDADIYIVENKEIANKLKSYLSKNTNATKEQIEGKFKNTKIEQGTYEQGVNQYINNCKWAVGMSEVLTVNQQFVIVNIKKLIEAAPKALDDVKGLVIADYQTELEKKWLSELKNKYKITINKEALKEALK